MPATDTPALTIGTRGSPLAMTQALLVRDALVAAHGLDVSIVTIATEGDRVQDRPLAEIGGKALWTHAIDAWLLDGRVDLAVHSLKDVETERPPAIALAAMLPRADVRDRLIGAPSIAALPRGARVGTSSPRRAAQLRALRPDLVIVPLRGNVATRLGKVEAGAVDATLLAAAGLDRLGLTDTGVAIAPAELLPAASQGAIGIEVRSADARTHALVAAIDDAPTRACVTAERAFLARLGADCHAAVAAHAWLADGTLWLEAELLDSDGATRLRDRVACATPDAPARLADTLLARAPAAVAALYGR